MRRALVIGSVVAVLAAAATEMAGGNGGLASANGDYGFSGQAAGSTFEMGAFKAESKTASKALPELSQ